METKKTNQKSAPGAGKTPRIFNTGLSQWKLEDKHKYKQTDRVSKAQPDKAMSIKHILSRHRAGMNDMISKQGQYPFENPDLDSYDLEKIQKMDLVEKHDLLQESLTNQLELQRQIKAIQDNQKLTEAKKQQRIDALLTKAEEQSTRNDVDHEKGHANDKGGTTAK